MAPPSDASDQFQPAADVAPHTAFKVNSPNVRYTPQHIISDYIYADTLVERGTDGSLVVNPVQRRFQFKTDVVVPKVGLMMVGWGGNNGSTLTASILANKHGITWRAKRGLQRPNYYGSLTQASTLKLGTDAKGADVHIPFSQILPMVQPNDLVLGGWDISSFNLAQAMERAEVLDYDLQRQIAPLMESMRPLPSIYYSSFIAANQSDRADNLIPGPHDKAAHLARIRADIRDFKAHNQLDKVIVVWTANTERYSDVVPGVNDTADNLLRAVEQSHEEISPSTVFALACILEHVPFINGSPQNTFVPGAMELAERERSFIGGDDFKSGQTKFKSVIVDFLVNAGIKPVGITSYNHLGNNDGKNLSSQAQFRSKEISKSSVVDDMVAANDILYDRATGEHPDHTVVIKYVPSAGDSKRALDEYESDIFMGGRQSISVYNICEDSLLAAPLILDLAIVAELMTRINYREMDGGQGGEKFRSFHPVLSILAYLLKAPVVKPGAPVINALAKQRAAMENLFRACVGLAPVSEMRLEERLW